MVQEGNKDKIHMSIVSRGFLSRRIRKNGQKSVIPTANACNNDEVVKNRYFQGLNVMLGHYAYFFLIPGVILPMDRCTRGLQNVK